MARRKKNKEEEYQTVFPAMITVTLQRELVLAGVTRKPGEQVEVRPRQVEWLKEQGVI